MKFTESERNFCHDGNNDNLGNKGNESNIDMDRKTSLHSVEIRASQLLSPSPFPPYVLVTS
jgi:hypothetical protein